MREKHWKNCPACGAKDSMRRKTLARERFQPRGYPVLEIKDLDGQFCQECGEGFLSLASERRVTREMAAHMAHHDQSRIVAAELASVREAAELLKVTPQGIHKMMDEGRLNYVVAGGIRLPIRKAVLTRQTARSPRRKRTP